MAGLQLEITNQLPVDIHNLTLHWTPATKDDEGRDISSRAASWLITIYEDVAERNVVLSNNTNQNSYTVPNGILQANVSYFVRVIQFYAEDTLTKSIESDLQLLTTKTDSYNIQFSVSPERQLLTNYFVGRTTVSWNIPDNIWQMAQSVEIPVFQEFGVSPKITEKSGFEVVTIDGSVTFKLNLYLANGGFIARTATAYTIHGDATISEGEFDWNKVDNGDHIIKAKTAYFINLKPTKIKDITIYFNFMKNNRIYSIPVSDTNQIATTDINVTVPVIGEYLNQAILATQKGVSGSWGYIAHTTEGTVIENKQVETFKFVNLTENDTGGGRDV
jgi:hypothetical protein